MPSTVLRPGHRAHEGALAPPSSPGAVASAVDWNDRLAAARPEEFTELFHEAVTDDFGAVARLHQMLETASQWCRARGARGSTSELDILASRLTDLGEELHLVRERLGRELHSRSHRTTAAARTSTAMSVRASSGGRQNTAPASPPPTVGSLSRSR